jgi:hypothetical protein
MSDGESQKKRQYRAMLGHRHFLPHVRELRRKQNNLHLWHTFLGQQLHYLTLLVSQVAAAFVVPVLFLL